MLRRWRALSRRAKWLAVAAAAVVLALALAAVWALFVPVADWLAHHDVGSVKGSLHETAVDNARGRLLTLGAGLFAAGALIFTALNAVLSRRSVELSRRAYELTEQGQVTDRYTKAIEQLGSDKLDVRIGGIYALERVARDSARDHPTVMEVLTAFIREHSHEEWPPSGDPVPRRPERLTRPDIQVAATVVGRRDPDRDIRFINLGGAKLYGSYLGSSPNFAGAFLIGVDLGAAGLGSANLAGAQLVSAQLNGAFLEDANLAGANLMMANLNAAHLQRADFTGAKLNGASLEHAYLGGAVLDHAVLDQTELTGATWPVDTPVPVGWRIDTVSGRLDRAGADSGPTESDGSQNGGSSE